MVSFTASLVAFATIMGVIAMPTEGLTEATVAKRSTPNGSGNNNGFYYQFCK